MRVEYQRRINRHDGVKRHEQRIARIDRLQQVHPVRNGNGRFLARTTLGMIDPAGPAALAFGHHALVAMQIGHVFLIGKSAQYRPLIRRCVLQHLQRFICVAGEYHAVINLRFTLAVGHLHQPVRTRHAHRRTVQANAVAECSDEFFHIAMTAASNRVPLVLVAHIEQRMVLEKLHEGRGGKIQHHLRRTTPDRATHRQQVIAHEAIAELHLLHQLAQR